MKEELLLDEQKIKKMKKRIKKSLENFGLDIKQSEVAQIIAHSLGFKNENALQKSLSENKNLNNENLQNFVLEKNESYCSLKDFFLETNKNYYIDSYNAGNKKIIFVTFNSKNRRDKEIKNDDYIKMIDHLFNSYIKSESGNILICGTAGSGKTLMTKSLVERSKKTLNKLISLGDIKELEIGQKISEEELRLTIDFELLKKYKHERIIFSIHESGVNVENKIKRLNSIANHCNTEIDIENIKIIIQLEWK